MSLNDQYRSRYRLLSLLGRGAIGEVYLAEDTYIGRQVAVKVIRLDSIPHFHPRTAEIALLLFQREAQVLARLNHPHILPLLDYGQVIVNGNPYISFVMPLCHEGSLATWICQRGSPPVFSLQEVSHILSQAAGALQHAHNQHITHLNFKPQNFLMRSRGDSSPPDFYLADFGIAKFVATASASQKACGSPIYMAPEQWEGYSVPATDQYALAVMIYQLLAGRPPYIGSQEQIIYQHFHVPPQSPSHFKQYIPADIDAIICRALAKRPENRFESIFTFAHTFYQAHNNTVRSSHSTPQSPKHFAAAFPASKPESTHNRSRARMVGIGLIILALLILVGGISSSIILSHLSTATGTTTIPNEIVNAQVATATMKKANPNPYPPYTGTLILYDPMTSDRFNWTNGSTNDATCTFSGGAYHVMGKKRGSANPCLGSGILFSNYSNFVFEVQMTIISGTAGGIRFRISSVGSYNFVVYQDGHYELTSYDSYGDYQARLLGATVQSSIKTGLKQTNMIAVVASGSHIDLYVNSIRIGSTIDSFSSQGSFGLIADQESNVAYSNARLWTW
jgi:eukaryotic-like serine/threonine-protein kinase